jgi:hypothetical protein
MASDQVIGFTVHGHHNDSYMYLDADPPACSACGLVTDPTWVNPDYTPKRSSMDLGQTYDGATIASKRFVDFVGDRSGARFLSLPAAPGFSVLVVDRFIGFDAEGRGTRFTELCERCGRYGQVAGAVPVVLREGEQIRSGFNATDVAFGSVVEPGQDRCVALQPVVIVDAALGESLRTQRFRGLDLNAIRH